MKTAEQKEVAIQCLEKLGIYKPYINKFKSKAGTPCFFEGFAGFYVDQEPEIYNKMKEIEAERGYLVYAITHEFLDFGECWSMLCVPKDNNGVDDLVFDTGSPRCWYAFAYVWNKSDPELSEAGDIIVRSAVGGLKRIG
jgi:hypothetical protein